MWELPPEQQAMIDELDGYERSGDASAARAMFDRVGGLPSSPAAVLDLLEVARLEDVGCAPSWVHDRWVARQAQRWLPRDPAGRLEPALDQTSFAVHPTDPPGPGEELTDFARRSVDDYLDNWLAHQVGVYELGGLAAFVAARSTPALTDKARSVRQWAEAPWGVYVSGHLTAGTLDVHDLRSHETIRVLHLGAQSEQPAGQCWLGRVVPTDDDPGHLFESPPLPLAETTARALADGDLTVPRVMAALRDAVHLGALPRGFASRVQTDLVSDLPGRRPPFGCQHDPLDQDHLGLRPEEVAAAARLDALGLDHEQIDAVLTLDAIREAVAAGDDGPARLTPMLVPSLLEDGPRSALLRHRAGAGQAEVWRHVRHHLPPFVRERCRAMVEASAAALRDAGRSDASAAGR